MINKIITNAIMIFGFSLITISTAAAAATISIGNGSAGVGGTVVVPLMINDVIGAGSAEVNLTYDPSVVISVNITNSDFDYPPQDPPINPQSGYVIINAMQFATGLDGNVKIGDITLQAVGDEGESSPLHLKDVILQDMAMQDIPIDGVINGVFEVRDVTPPVVTDPSANPHIISNDGVMESRLNITVTDNNAIESVTIDLSPVGGSQSQAMSQIGPNKWTVTTGAALSGVHDLTVNATDVWGNSNTSTSIELIVVEPAVIEIGTAVHIQLGETVIVPLLINGVSADAGVGVVEVNLTYDPSVVIPVSITSSDFDLPPQDPPINPESGYVIINAMQISSGLSGTVKIGDITLQAVGNEGESSPLNLTDIALQDMAQQDIPVGDAVNGTFKINGAPDLDPIGSQSVDEGQTLSFTISADDPDGDALTFSASNLPAGANFNPANRMFSWTPTFEQAGVYENVHFEVTDGNLTDWENITITVNNTNRAPAVSGLVNQSGIVGAAWTYDISTFISDPDGDPLTVTADDDNVSVSGFVLTFNYTIAVEDKPVLITVTDAGGLSGSQTVFVTAVAPDNIAPIITNPTANPSAIPDDTDDDPGWGETSRLNVTVTDNSGVAGVTIDLSPIGGSSAQPMTNLNGVWTVSTSAPAGTAHGTYHLQVNATDIYGTSNTSVSISLTVIKNGDFNDDGIVDFMNDAVYLVRHTRNVPGYETLHEEVADVTGDGEVDFMGDGVYLVRHTRNVPGYEILH